MTLGILTDPKYGHFHQEKQSLQFRTWQRFLSTSLMALETNIAARRQAKLTTPPLTEASLAINELSRLRSGSCTAGKEQVCWEGWGAAAARTSPLLQACTIKDDKPGLAPPPSFRSPSTYTQFPGKSALSSVPQKHHNLQRTEGLRGLNNRMH